MQLTAIFESEAGRNIGPRTMIEIANSRFTRIENIIGLLSRGTRVFGAVNTRLSNSEV